MTFKKYPVEEEILNESVFVDTDNGSMELDIIYVNDAVDPDTGIASKAIYDKPEDCLDRAEPISYIDMDGFNKLQELVNNGDLTIVTRDELLNTTESINEGSKSQDYKPGYVNGSWRIFYNCDMPVNYIPKEFYDLYFDSEEEAQAYLNSLDQPQESTITEAERTYDWRDVAEVLSDYFDEETALNLYNIMATEYHDKPLTHTDLLDIANDLHDYNFSEEQINEILQRCDQLLDPAADQKDVLESDILTLKDTLDKLLTPEVKEKLIQLIDSCKPTEEVTND